MRLTNLYPQPEVRHFSCAVRMIEAVPCRDGRVPEICVHGQMNVPATKKIKHDSAIFRKCTVGIWNPDLSVFRMVEKRLGCKWSGFQMASEIRSNGRHFAKSQLKSGQKCTDFEWSGFWEVGTIAFIDIKMSIYRQSLIFFIDTITKQI